MQVTLSLPSWSDIAVTESLSWLWGRLSATALCARGLMTVWSRKWKVKRWFYLLRIFFNPITLKNASVTYILIALDFSKGCFDFESDPILFCVLLLSISKHPIPLCGLLLPVKSFLS